MRSSIMGTGQADDAAKPKKQVSIYLFDHFRDLALYFPHFAILHDFLPLLLIQNVQPRAVI